MNINNIPTASTAASTTTTSSSSSSSSSIHPLLVPQISSSSSQSPSPSTKEFSDPLLSSSSPSSSFNSNTTNNNNNNNNNNNSFTLTSSSPTKSINSLRNFIRPTSSISTSSNSTGTTTTTDISSNLVSSQTVVTTSTSNNHRKTSINSSRNHGHNRKNSTQTIATDALLFQNLRAQTQSLGLDHESIGWSIVQSISSNNNRSIDRAIPSLIQSQSDRTRLLLILPRLRLINPIDPLTLLTQYLLITHPSPSSEESQRESCGSTTTTTTTTTTSVELYFISLSGSRGLIEGDRIVFTSTGKPINLNSLDEIDISSLVSRIRPPTSLSTELTSPAKLRFPSHQLLSPTSKPLTIPRPSSLGNLSSSPSSSLGRSTATQRLASLFGNGNQNLRTEDLDPITVDVQVIEKGIDPTDLNQSTRRAIENRIRDGLGSLEEELLVRIAGFVSKLFPQDAQHQLSVDQLSAEIQSLYESIDHDLEVEYSSDPEEERQDETESEVTKRMIIDHTLELIEEVLCLELYDRLFEEIEFDEDLHLAEKIAGLNLIDVTLDHLGLDLERRQMDDPEGINAIRSGLDDIINLASRELSRLQDEECKCPRDKVGVFVTVHKLIVEGLSSLPPIPMKKEDGAANSSTGALSDHSAYTEVEMSDNIDRSSLGPSKAAAGRELPNSSPLRKIDIGKPSPSDLMDAIETDLIETPPIPNLNVSNDSTPKKPPKVEQPPRPRANSSSADLILPILIYLIIKTNPPRLLSNLTFVNRYRYRRLIRGETDYCLVNFNVSCEFIKNFGQDGFGDKSFQSLGQPKPARWDSGPRTIPQDQVKYKTHQRTGSGRVTGYGTFTGLGHQPPSLREKAGNEVEDALIAASRAVSGVLMGGYQRVISGSILDSPAARLKFGSGNPTLSGPPRTLEDVKRLIGSSTVGSRREGGLVGWSNRVGLLRRPTNPGSVARGEQSLNDAPNSSTAKRLTSLFQNNNSSANQQEDRLSSISNRLSNITGLGRLGGQPLTSKPQDNSQDSITRGSSGSVGSRSFETGLESHNQNDSREFEAGSAEDSKALKRSDSKKKQRSSDGGGGEILGEQYRKYERSTVKPSRKENGRDSHERTSNDESNEDEVEVERRRSKFERCESIDELTIGEIKLLLKDFKRLSKKLNQKKDC